MNVRLARFQQGVFEALNGAADLVAWGRQNQPRGDNAGSILSLQLESGDSRRVGHRSLQPLASAELLVTSATLNDIALVRINGLEVHHDVAAGESIQDVRDALLADLQGLSPEPFTAASVSTDRIALTANSLGGIWSLAAAGSVTIDDGQTVLAVDGGGATQHVEVLSVSERYQLALEAFSADTEPRRGAHAILSDARSRLKDREASLALARFGVKRWELGPAIDLSAIAGAYWESRARLTVECALRNVRVTARDPIESVTLNLTANDP